MTSFPNILSTEEYGYYNHTENFYSDELSTGSRIAGYSRNWGRDVWEKQWEGTVIRALKASAYIRRSDGVTNFSVRGENVYKIARVRPRLSNNRPYWGICSRRCMSNNNEGVLVIARITNWKEFLCVD